MESRKQNIDDLQELYPTLKDRVGRVFGRSHCFAGIHVFTSSIDVPDDYGTGPRLVVLPPHQAYHRSDDRLACEAAEQILRKRGDQPRQKQNRLIFFAADYDVMSRLKDAGRTFLAWKSIVNDVNDGKLDLTVSLSKQAKRNVDNAEQDLQRLIRDAYKWIICPVEEFRKGKPELIWETVSVSPTAPNLVAEIENKLREEEWLISEWSPIHLRNTLKQWYLKDGAKEVSALKVWQDSCHFLYLPRLVNNQTYENAISAGITSEDFFAYAAGKDGDKYLGFILYLFISSFYRLVFICVTNIILSVEGHSRAEKCNIHSVDSLHDMIREGFAVLLPRHHFTIYHMKAVGGCPLKF